MKAFIFGLGLWLLMTACNKVDQHYNLVAGQPWINGSYPTTYYVGDTMTISGLMFIGEGGVLQVGPVQPSFLSMIKTAGAPGTSAADSQETVRFLITKEMGIGKNIPVTLTAHGIVVQTPAITILQFSGVLSRTDTTLWVDQIASWQPANLAAYQNQNIPLIIGSSVSSNGNIYFDNPWGVFAMTGGAVQPVLSVGGQLSDKNGPFTVNKVLGSAISFDGNTLAFSVAVSDNSDTVNNYVFRFCTMDMGSKTITTVNRTLEQKGIPGQAGTPGAYTGPAGQLNLVAAAIQTDVNGNWYFANIYAVPYPGYDMGSWYANTINNPFHGGLNELDNICELGMDGKISSLFSFSAAENSGGYAYTDHLFKPSGFPIASISNASISQDGSTAYITDKFYGNAGIYNIAAYNLNQQVELSSPAVTANFKFISFDTSAATGVASFFESGLFDSYVQTGGVPIQFLALSDDYVLSSLEFSIYAFNVLNQTFYCYAGTEQGVLGNPPAVQDQATGRAKYVNFGLNGNNCYLNGIDAQGAVYYFTAPGSFVQPVLGGPISFYKLYSKK
jgi:hypothetical protein